MKPWFTSDTHFGHKKIALIRGFADADEMDNTLVANWNRQVAPSDTVFHLGDLSFMKTEPTLEVLKRLNGKIKLVPGNHDDPKMMAQAASRLGERFAILPPLATVKLSIAQPDGTSEVERLVLCHFPMMTWNRSHFGVPHLHGHSHGSMRYPNPAAKIHDVGVDPNGLAPVSLDEILRIMSNKTIVSWDRHEEVTL